MSTPIHSQEHLNRLARAGTPRTVFRVTVSIDLLEAVTADQIQEFLNKTLPEHFEGIANVDACCDEIDPTEDDPDYWVDRYVPSRVGAAHP